MGKVFRSYKISFECPDEWTEEQIVAECDKFDGGEVGDKVDELMEDNGVHEDITNDVEVIL